jgi:lysosomal acid lipase/cholesteryl ester hydrolase
MGKSVWFTTTTLAITISILSLLNTANSFDGGGTNPKPQPTLCDELILPAGYPCSEYVVSIHYVFTIIPFLFCVLIYIVAFSCSNFFQVQTTDGFLLGLQRVSSSSARIKNDGERGPPVLLLHGLFMVTSFSSLNLLYNANNVAYWYFPLFLFYYSYVK